jgi:hypothetical protein
MKPKIPGSYQNELVLTYRPLVFGYAAAATINYLFIALNLLGHLDQSWELKLAISSFLASFCSALTGFLIRRSSKLVALEAATMAINIILLFNISYRIYLEYQTVQLGYLPAFAMGAAVLCVSIRVLALNTLLILIVAFTIVKSSDLVDFTYVLGGGVAMSIALFALMRNAIAKQMSARFRAETSRKWLWPSGWKPPPVYCFWMNPRAAWMWAPNRKFTSCSANSRREALRF